MTVALYCNFTDSKTLSIVRWNKWQRITAPSASTATLSHIQVWRLHKKVSSSECRSYRTCLSAQTAAAASSLAIQGASSRLQHVAMKASIVSDSAPLAHITVSYILEYTSGSCIAVAHRNIPSGILDCHQNTTEIQLRRHYQDLYIWTS